jgi:ribosomal protein L33
LVLPHLVYSAAILYSANKNDIGRLQKLQNRAMRIILKERRDTSIRSMLDKLNWLSVEKFVKFQVMTLIYKIKKSLAPNYLSQKLITFESVHSYPTRNKSNFYVTTKNKKSTEKSLFHKGLLDFNDLPQEIKNAQSLNMFKNRLRVYFRGE